VVGNGYEVLVKLTVDDLLEREELAADIRGSHGHRDPAAVGASMVRETHPA
jgi:hypothetical protein